MKTPLNSIKSFFLSEKKLPTPALSSDQSTNKAKLTNSSLAKQEANKSIDLFETSSADELSQEEETKKTPQKATELPIKITDDTGSTSSSPATSNRQSRQRSLLDMLDQSYENDSAAPSSKRTFFGVSSK